MTTGSLVSCSTDSPVDLCLEARPPTRLPLRSFVFLCEDALILSFLGAAFDAVDVVFVVVAVGFEVPIEEFFFPKDDDAFVGFDIAPDAVLMLSVVVG